MGANESRSRKGYKPVPQYELQPVPTMLEPVPTTATVEFLDNHWQIRHRVFDSGFIVTLDRDTSVSMSLDENTNENVMLVRNTTRGNYCHYSVHKTVFLNWVKTKTNGHPFTYTWNQETYNYKTSDEHRRW